MIGHYEPRWSKDEQAMIDMMRFGGADVNFFTYYNQSCEFKVEVDGRVISGTKDTEYEAVRVAFDRWNKVKDAKN